MSLLTAEPREKTFLARFEHVWASLRRFQVGQGLCSTFLVASLGLFALSALDFWQELPWSTRAGGLAAASVLVVAVFLARVVAPLTWWTKPRTAVEIERRFPALGQRIRTVVQFAGHPDDDIHQAGVTPSLVGALEDETEAQVKPLPLDRVVPWRQVWAAACVAAVPALVLLYAAATNLEWRTAVERALLGTRPYSTLAVTPGSLRVEQGESLTVTADLKGRPRRDFVVQYRPASGVGSDWKTVEMTTPVREKPTHRVAKLEKIKDPVAYRVVAGPASSPTYTIDVRYPLAFKTFEVAITPPAYTGLKPGTVKGGDFSVVEGTGATFRIAFDGRPSEASIVMVNPADRAKEKNAPPAEVIRLTDEDSIFGTTMTLTKGLIYRIEARTADGRVLPKNRYKIDVHEDRSPRVSFEEPSEALEVHPIAEILNRVRVGDDFGLSKAGIVFRFNDGEEQTLVARDFTKSDKRETAATLEETLLMEKLAASPTDSVTYYAFAEDNYPAGAKRTETDLRYVDIRPFKREYKKAEGDGDVPETDGESVALNELIARQRYNLNRGVRLAKRKATDKSPAEDPLKIAGFEETLAGMVREFTEGVENVAGERVEPLHQAEEAMLAAIAALDRGNNTASPPYMAEALKRLIEVRKTIREIIGDANPAQAQALRRFDRTQAQKIRKPKKESEEAEEIAERLEELAKEEDFVYATIPRDGTADSEKGEGSGESKEAEPKKAESKEAETKEAADSKDEKGSDQPKGKAMADAKGEQGEGDGENGPGKNDPREVMKKQESIADEARELEEKLKKLEAVSELAKARMAKAAETVDKASGALGRGNTKEASETAKAGASMLHEVARQVKGEVAREVADELAMARDLAAELAEREAELAEMSGGAGDKEGPPGKNGKGTGGLTEAEKLEELKEAAKTLEEWLKGASLRAEGEAAERVREALEDVPVMKVVERMERVGELILGGQRPEARKEAKDLSEKLEMLSRRLDTLHRNIVAPQIAALADVDKRVGELIEKLQTLKTDADITEWHREAERLVAELQKAGLIQAAATLSDAMKEGGWNDRRGAWDWALNAEDGRVAPDGYTRALNRVAAQIQDKLQDLVLKDVVSAHDEATPPEFKELVERYYEVLSGGGKDR